MNQELKSKIWDILIDYMSNSEASEVCSKIMDAINESKDKNQ